MEEILEKYAEFVSYTHPDFLIWKHQQIPQQAQQANINPMQPGGMINPMLLQQ